MKNMFMRIAPLIFFLLAPGMLSAQQGLRLPCFSQSEEMVPRDVEEIRSSEIENDLALLDGLGASESDVAVTIWYPYLEDTQGKGKRGDFLLEFEGACQEFRALLREDLLFALDEARQKATEARALLDRFIQEAKDEGDAIDEGYFSAVREKAVATFAWTGIPLQYRSLLMRDPGSPRIRTPQPVAPTERTRLCGCSRNKNPSFMSRVQKLFCCCMYCPRRTSVIKA